MASFGEDNRAATQREEGSSQNKYGGISPKKPLINKDHERAYFDSADWALGKQGASNSTKGTTEPLKPKLQVAETVRVWQGNHRGGIEFDPIINWDVNMDIVSM
ncbi:hypothetical protein OsI_01568 [Oryza sativa Indica Group]|uniref:Uncharacterized protein n=1 Tax=Oryza sativa subsp. indica TaxID=39946 RepID=B8A6R2_ORYSI|nr:hypothetical protein OsI_01568 [Oryza sativa Indica Group]